MDNRREDRHDDEKGPGLRRALEMVERQELKQRVEQAARSGPRIPYQRLRSFLLLIVIACPLGGTTLLGLTRRCQPPLSA